MPIRIHCSFRQLFLSFYKMDSKSGETIEQTKEMIKNGKKKWTDDEVQDLTELLEEKLCLLDIFSNEYTERVVKERAYTELAKHFDFSSAIAKAKINALRAQLGREMAKESKTKRVRQQAKSMLANGCFMEASKTCKCHNKCDALRDLVPFVQFKKRGKRG